eukprot:gb/GFBE01062761.1/.p1 GENE.gb/GFBE01062761.1/~~gb/GFBE01062761.1/.p1  ORF type:complete len:372 (+),score=62.72 gb/GFBE01062761.1/:1-1116(+)
MMFPQYLVLCSQKPREPEFFSGAGPEYQPQRDESSPREQAGSEEHSVTPCVTPEQSPRWGNSPPPSPWTDYSGCSTATTPTGVDDRSASPQAMQGCYQPVQIFVPIVIASYPYAPFAGPFPKQEDQHSGRKETDGQVSATHTEEDREISQEAQEEQHFPCDCGIDRAACGVCGKGWAQVPQDSTRQEQVAAALKTAASVEVDVDEKEVPTQAPEEPVPSGSIASRPVPLGYTTLVVRNIPARYNQEMLLHEFGWEDATFDFLHLPYSFRDQRTMGYAFLNFRTHELALEFQERRHHTFLQDHGRTKYLDVTAATKQGLAANLEQFSPKSIARLQRVGMLPIFLNEAGVRLDPLREMQRHGLMPVPAAGRRY